MKILLCAHDRPGSINGPNVWLQRLLPNLLDEGIQSSVLFFPSGNPEQCPTITFLKNKGFQCDVYSGNNYTEFKTRWILEKVKKDPPDVFIPNLSIPAYFASKWIKDSGIPTIGMLRSNDPFYRAILHEFIQKPAVPYLSAVVCVSKYLEDVSRETCEGKLVISRIPSGTPFPDKVAQRNDSVLRMIYAGRLIERQKCISEVTRAMCRATTEVAGVEGILYGSGPAEPDVKKILNEYGEHIPVKLGGLLESHELMEKLSEGHIFVMLSEYEGLPIALMEAMALGMVPVCYNMVSGIPELVEDGKSGLIVNDRGEEFITAIKRLRNEKGLWKELSEGAREKISSGYSIQYVKQIWVELINHVIKNSPEKKKAIVIPHKIDLPPRNQNIRKYEDTRWPGYVEHCTRKLNNVIKRVIRK